MQSMEAVYKPAYELGTGEDLSDKVNDREANFLTNNKLHYR